MNTANSLLPTVRGRITVAEFCAAAGFDTATYYRRLHRGEDLPRAPIRVAEARAWLSVKLARAAQAVESLSADE